MLEKPHELIHFLPVVYHSSLSLEKILTIALFAVIFQGLFVLRLPSVLESPGPTEDGWNSFKNPIPTLAFLGHSGTICHWLGFSGSQFWDRNWQVGGLLGTALASTPVEGKGWKQDWPEREVKMQCGLKTMPQLTTWDISKMDWPFRAPSCWSISHLFWAALGKGCKLG